MKFLLAAILATAVLATKEDEISHVLRSMREEISELKTHYKQLEAENRALRSDVDELKSQRMPDASNNESAPDPLRNESTTETSSKQLQTKSDDLAGEIRFFGLDNCPFGWEEVNSTRGYMIVSRPLGAKTMQYFGKPLKSGESSRAGAPHTHKTTVTDPGHSHKTSYETEPVKCPAFPYGSGGGCTDPNTPCYSGTGGQAGCKPFPGTPATTYATWTGLPTATHANTTKHCCPGVQHSLIPSDPAKAGTAVNVAASTGDTYPLMYMLACVSTQSAGALRVAEGHTN